MLKQRRGANCRFIFILIIVIAIPLYFTIVSYSSLFVARSIYLSTFFDAYFASTSSSLLTNENTLHNNDYQLTILAWTDRWGRPYPLDVLYGCQNSQITNKCRMVNDPKFLNQSSAVIFHVRDISYMKMPPYKPDGSKFVFFSHESPEMTFITLKGLPVGYFDWTMTYKLDSDIYCPYGYMEPNDNPLDTAWMKYAEGKTKLIAWYVSNCQTDSRRERYVYELQKHLTVDIFGVCGTRSCPKSNSSNCNDYLRKTYKFYLSLDNSACKDYVTEKFFYRLSEYVVPIVLRRSDYVNIAPNMSYIALDDFQSPKHLADYLLHLDKNQTEYLQYFAWRKHYDVVTEKMSRYCYCGLCEKLWQEKQSGKSQNQRKLDIHKWWYVDSACDHKYAYNLLKRKPT